MSIITLFRKTGLVNDPLAPALVTMPAEDPCIASEYNRVANKLGVATMPSNQNALLQVLQEEMIPIYSLAAVEKFMDDKGYWGWFPFGPRIVDVNLVRETATEYPSLYGSRERGLYRDPVPLPVLLTMERIKDQMGDNVQFYVAATSKHPDPFLGVLQIDDPRRKLVVVERWDEPSFRG